MTSATLCASSVIVKWRRQCLLLSLQLGSQTPCKLLDADHDDTRKYFFDDDQKTEISISAAGCFGEMKKTETSSKRRRVGRYAIVIADRHNARNDSSSRDRLYQLLLDEGLEINCKKTFCMVVSKERQRIQRATVYAMEL